MFIILHKINIFTNNNFMVVFPRLYRAQIFYYPIPALRGYFTFSLMSGCFERARNFDFVLLCKFNNRKLKNIFCRQKTVRDCAKEQRSNS